MMRDARRGRLTGLVVENNPSFRKMLVYALARLPQLSIVEADSAADALRRSADTTFAIIITGIDPPTLDGLGLVKQLRADENHKHVPIVVITAENAEQDREQAMALGASGHITRPIQASAVNALVRELVGLD